MIKKLILIVVVLLMATNCYAWVQGSQGSKNTEICYMTGTGPVTSGDVVVLQTSSPTYWGREVTGITTAGLHIHGVVVDNRNYTNAEMADGEWVSVQTKGYCPIVKLAWRNGAVTANTTGSALCTSIERFRATSSAETAAQYPEDHVTGCSVALETKRGSIGDPNADYLGTSTIKAYLR